MSMNPAPDPALPAAAAAAHALWLLHTHRGQPAEAVEQLLARHPRHAAGHRLRAGLLVAADKAGARGLLAQSLAVLDAAQADPGHPDRRHAEAARAWLAGDAARALERYGAIVVDWPHDLLALVVASALDFRLGRRRMLRDRLAQVLPEWHDGLAGHASVLAMYAFGLEENGEDARAEPVARHALALDPGHPGALHALSHVLDTQGRAREGLALLDAQAAAWTAPTGYAVHLAWHRALFHLDAGEPAAALAVYDAHIAPASGVGRSVLADAAALLWRLDLRGVDVAARWQPVADGWARQALDAPSPFDAMHAVMAFAATARTAAARRVCEALRLRPPDEAHDPAEALLVRRGCEALLAFARGDYAACSDRLAEVLHDAHRCGGSLAQCDVVHLTCTEAALRAQRARLARALVAERAARRPGSVINQGLLARVQALGDGSGNDQAPRRTPPVALPSLAPWQIGAHGSASRPAAPTGPRTLQHGPQAEAFSTLRQLEGTLS